MSAQKYNRPGFYRSYSLFFFLSILFLSGWRNSFSNSDSQLKHVCFQFQPVISGVREVYLAGTFNDWDNHRDRMTDADQDGIYEICLSLPVGRYLYKFVSDGQWIADPNASGFEPDGQGGRNSVLVVDENYDAVVYEKGDGRIETDGLPLIPDYSMINPIDASHAEITYWTHKSDVSSVFFVRMNDGFAEPVSMQSAGADEAFEYFKTTVRLSADPNIRFAFILQDGDQKMVVSPDGFTDHLPQPEKMFLFKSLEMTPAKSPDWVKTGIFYQIFPERFCNGDTANDPDFTEKWYEGCTSLSPSGKKNGDYFHLVKDWNDIAGLTVSPYRTDSLPDYYSFYGGDIKGVTDRLDYLADLGITIIYFNPLNIGRSNHKYDPIDYLTIDPHFADEATFKTFVDAAHQKGIRIVVDMAFNHTGDWHYAFVDTKEKGPQSEYWDWYEWNKWPLPQEGCPTPCDYYDCWWGFPIHPNLNFDLSRPNAEENDIWDIREADPNKAVVDYILQVANYWIGDLGIDGFRLDVPNEVPFWFWKLFREKVESLNPDAFLIGEIWGNAINWLGPDCFHAVMNYKYFRDPVLQFFIKRTIDAMRFDNQLTPGRMRYPQEAALSMMNLIGSHDTERMLRLAEGNVDRIKLAVLFQMTYFGVPHIYYGDEVALDGGKDPDNRRPFPWNWQTSESRKEIHAYDKTLIAIRKQYPALSIGEFKTIYASGQQFVYTRSDATDLFVIAINNSESESKLSLNVPQQGKYQDLLSQTSFHTSNDSIALSLQPMSGRILKKIP